MSGNPIIMSMIFLTPLVHPDIPLVRLKRCPDMRLDAVTTKNIIMVKMQLLQTETNLT